MTHMAHTVESVQSRAPARFRKLGKLIRDVGCDAHWQFKNNYTVEGGYAIQQNPDELAAAIIVLAHEPLIIGGSYLEIGSASGGVCRLLSEQLGFCSTAVIDDRQHPRAGEQDQNFAAMVYPPAVFVGDSHSPEAARFAEVEAPYDLAFIDGDHSYEGCSRDFLLVRPHTRYVMFHDAVEIANVRRVWDEAVAAGQLVSVAELAGQERPLGLFIGKVC